MSRCSHPACVLTTLSILLFYAWLTPASSTAQPHGTAYPFQSISPAAIPSVAIIGTAKAGTTDLYTLLAKTSSSGSRQRVKEAKLLVEDGRTLLPGHADFQEYLQRIGHPCAATVRESSSPAAGVLLDCIEAYCPSINVSAAGAAAASSQPCSSLPLSIDASPIYLAMPRAAIALRAISTETKIIVLLRDPVDRAESLYNHRVHTEAKGILPTRVRNLTINEWADKFLEWVDKTPKVKPLLARLSQDKNAWHQALLYQELVAANILGLPEGSLNFSNYNRHGHIERNVFGTGLYAPALSVWRTRYFAPGRVMVVDSHHFFENRLGVLGQVFEFVHGRQMSASELSIAKRTSVQNARRRKGIRFSGAQLSGNALQNMQAFYRPHVEMLVQHVLPALREEGALVVGFDKHPWSPVQQR